ncbi:MAG: IPTL-CTERM sorting domain-containing protein [Thermoanaerobaculia bacterium]
MAKSVVTPGPYEAGDIVTYRITVTNDGTDDSTDVTVIDALPEDLRFVSASASDGTCSEAAETVTCQLGVLGTGASETVDIVVTLWDSGVLTNTAEASMIGGEVDTSDNAATVAITAGPAEFTGIPTLSEWALILFGALLGITALVRARS